MNFLQSIKRLFSIYFGKMTVEKRLLFSHVERDWTIMFSVSVLLLVAMGGLGAYLFMSLGQESLVVERSVAARASQIESFNKKELNEVVEFFEKRNSEFKDIKSNPPKFPDPLR